MWPILTDFSNVMCITGDVRLLYQAQFFAMWRLMVSFGGSVKAKHIVGPYLLKLQGDNGFGTHRGDI